MPYIAINAGAHTGHPYGREIVDFGVRMRISIHPELGIVMLRASSRYSPPVTSSPGPGGQLPNIRPNTAPKSAPKMIAGM